jgi:hypothetical protein
MTADAINGGKFTDAARQALERYVSELRFLLRGCSTVDPAEVEAEVRSHIDQELANSPHPVSSERLDAILARLGSPTQWVPIDELPWWRRALIRLRMGPASDRWALGVFALWVLGLMLLPAAGLGLFAIVASFLLARAVLAMSEEAGSQLMWRRWLVYPSLLSVYVPLITLVLGLGGFAAALPSEAGGQWRRDLGADELARVEHPVSALFSGVAGLGVWWVIVGVTLLLVPRLPSRIFHPFFTRPARRRGVALLSMGVLLSLTGAIGLIAWLS